MKYWKEIKTLNLTSAVSLLLIFGMILACGQKETIDLCVIQPNIGNGLAIHPTSSQILISKPSGKQDQHHKNQYSLFELTKTKKGALIEKQLRLNSNYSDYHPVFSPDGRFLLFNSTRPKPNEENGNGKVDIYLSKIIDKQFSAPQYLEAINTEYQDSYPSLTNNNKLYFNSDRPGGKGMMDIYVSEFKENKWQTPQLVPALSSEHSENDLVVDPEERFIIFNRYFSETKEIELFISYREHNTWMPPNPMQEINQMGVWELTPTLSRDSKTLYLEINGAIECYDLPN